MNIFGMAKSLVTVREAAERYGLNINRHGMACCPFHEDRHPSMKLDERYGFFRRQIILTTKNRPKDRVDDPFLSEKLIAEAEGIFLWALEGLKRLIANNYQFTISEQARQNLEENISEGNNVTAFLKSEGYISFKADYEISSQRLYELYKLWCQENALNALSLHSFCVQMAALSGDYRLEQTNRIRVNGRYVRGYVGIYSDLPP